MLTKFLGYFNFKKVGWKDILASFFKLFFVKIFLIFILLCNLLLWLLSWLVVVNINQELSILHYNIIFGIDYIGNPHSIFWLPALGLIIALVNIIISLWLFQREKLLAQMLMLSTLVFHIFLGLSLYSIYLINFVNIKF
ncbi:MAG: hypothetical protein V1765_01535 [bacterium]